MSEQVVPSKVYVSVFVALVCATILTTAVAFVDLGPLNTIVAITIAAIKALLVILFFMHVRYSDKLLWVFVGAAFFWLLILFSLSWSDYYTRLAVSGIPGK